MKRSIGDVETMAAAFDAYVTRVQDRWTVCESRTSPVLDPQDIFDAATTVDDEGSGRYGILETALGPFDDTVVTKEDEEDAQFLVDNGYIVFRLGTDSVGLENQFRTMLTELEEFRKSDSLTFTIEEGKQGKKKKTKKYSRYAFGFGALGGASQFHHPFARRIRMMYHQRLRGVMKSAGKKLFGMDETVYMNVLFDRVRVAPDGLKCGSGEQAHRDLHPDRAPKTSVFGGWVNCDQRPQVFRCAPRTQIAMTSDYPEVVSEGFFEESTAGLQMSEITIPAGHGIVFFQSILHEVLPAEPRGYDSLRVFTGCRIAASCSKKWSQEADVRVCMDSQMVPRIPSGQIPAMYPANYLRFFKPVYQEWLAQCIHPSVFDSKKKKETLPRLLQNKSHYSQYGDFDKYVMLPHPL